MANQIKAQLPPCLLEKISVRENYWQVRVALFKKDTCYVIDRKTRDPGKISRHEIFMTNYNMNRPEYQLPEVYNKDCKLLNFIMNKDLMYTSKIYSREELDHLIKKSVIADNQIKADLSQCLIQKISTGDVYSEIRVALVKNDTCYVIKLIKHRTVTDYRRKDQGKMSRYEIQLINLNMPQPAKLEIYDKECKPIFPEKKDLLYTSKIYTREEVKHLVKN
ncbi:MAG: hypothetical protein WKF91_00325 [Segetibacter sp.]